MLIGRDYRCPKGHVFEKFSKGSEEFQKLVPCEEEGCTEQAEWQPSFFYNGVHAAQGFNPVVIHKDAKGNIRYPGRADAPVPKGFQKVELTTVQQVRQLEREQGSVDTLQAAKFRNARQMLTDGQLKENRRCMEKIVAGFTPRGKKFYDAMRKVSEMRQRQGPKATNPEFVVQAFSYDASNREAHFDERAEFGRRGGRK